MYLTELLARVYKDIWTKIFTVELAEQIMVQQTVDNCNHLERFE